VIVNARVAGRFAWSLKYGKLSLMFPVHYARFRAFQKRSRSKGLSVSFSDDASGLLLFIEDIGPVPEGMVKPSVGRKDHSKGYESGNFSWQSYSDNVRESNSRTRSGLVYSIQHRNNISKGTKGKTRRPLSLDHRLKISEGIKKFWRDCNETSTKD